MKRAGLANAFKFLAQPCHALADHAAVGFDLRFAGATKEAKATALSLKVGPRSDEPTLLIIKMGEFDLQPPFSGCRSFTEDFEDQSGTIDNLTLEPVFQIALLDRRERTVDNYEFCLVLLASDGDVVDLTCAEEGTGTDLAHRQDKCLGHDNADCKS